MRKIGIVLGLMVIAVSACSGPGIASPSDLDAPTNAATMESVTLDNVDAAFLGHDAMAADRASDGEVVSAKSTYDEAVRNFETCVEDKGFEIEMQPDRTGIFYVISYGSSGYDSLSQMEAEDAARDAASDDCFFSRLAEPARALEKAIGPSEEDLRQFALECAEESKVTLTETDLSNVGVAPPESVDVATCVVGRVQTSIQAKYEEATGNSDS